MTSLFVPVGIPGSGKSTWCDRMLDGSRVSSDDIRRRLFGSLRAAHDVDPDEKKNRERVIWDEFYGLVDRRLYDENVIADGTNLRDHAREKLRSIAQKRMAEIHVVVFNNTMQAFERNKDRDDDQVVPQDVMNSFLGLFNQEYPIIPTEAWTTYTEIARVD